MRQINTTGNFRMTHMRNLPVVQDRKRSPDERSDIRCDLSLNSPACRCAHAGYLLAYKARIGHLATGGASRGVVVEDDQRVDGDAGLGVDQEWIDVDRGDAVAGIRTQIGQA